MADTRATTLGRHAAAPAAGSRAARRLRRCGRVPGVLYGGGGDARSASTPTRASCAGRARRAPAPCSDLSVAGAARNDAGRPQGGTARPRARPDHARRPAARAPRTRRSTPSCRSSSPAPTTRPASSRAASSSSSRASSTSKPSRRRFPESIVHAPVGEMQIGRDTLGLDGDSGARGRHPARRGPEDGRRRDALAAPPADRGGGRRSSPRPSSSARPAQDAERPPRARAPPGGEDSCGSSCAARSLAALPAAG